VSAAKTEPVSGPPTIGELVQFGTILLGSIEVEQTATAKRAQSEFAEGLAQLERAHALLQYESKRQAIAKATREREAAEQRQTAIKKAEAEERAKHVRTLQIEAQRKRKLKEAEDYAKARGLHAK